jgi:hypothetical protein
MSDTILAGDLTVYYLDDNRRKQIRWTGSPLKTASQKQIDVYSAAEDLFTLPTQQNDGLIYSAETPGEYTIGIIDAGDLEPWFIDFNTMQHIIGDFANFTGCALKTSGWTRVLPADGTENIGILVVPVDSGGAIVEGDIGFDIVHASGDAGTLLDVVITGGATDYLWVRPDTNLLVDDFNTASGNLTANAHISVQAAIGHTGEMVWGNVFSQGALVSDTHIFIFKDGVKVTGVQDTDNDFWPDGQVDRPIPITDYQTTAFPIIDLAFLTVKANQYGSKYTNAVIRMNSASGGNVSAGLSSGNDITNTTGYASITVAGGTGNFTVGDEISGDVSTARAIITQIDNPGATATYHYYLVGDPLTDFNGSEAITNEDDTGAATSSGAVAAQGPALTTWFDGNAFPTYAFTSTPTDVDDDGNTEEYGIEINLLAASLAQMHEYNKFAQMRGSVLDHDGLDGEEWIGIDFAINFATISGTVAEGAVVTGATSGATGVVVSNPGGTNDTALIRNTRGEFVDGERIFENDGTDEFDAASLLVDIITPVAESSFGTLAGTSFFFSRGVVPLNYKGAEENLWSTIDAAGGPRSRPTTITMQILNLLQFDYASCSRLLIAGGAINKVEYSATGGEAIGDATLTVDGTIAADVPGKTTGGHFTLRDKDDNDREYVIRYSSYDAVTGVITLANVVIASATAATETTIQQVGAFATALVGDLVVNEGNGHNGHSYISQIVDDDNCVINPPITDQTTGDAIELNACPIVVNTLDDVFFFIVFEFKEANGLASGSMVYLGDIEARVVVRNTSDAAIKIKGYTADVQISTTGGVASATRIENTVYA